MSGSLAGPQKGNEKKPCPASVDWGKRGSSPVWLAWISFPGQTSQGWVISPLGPSVVVTFPCPGQGTQVRAGEVASR